MENRANFKIYIIGQSRTGKSTLAEKIAADVVKHRKLENILTHDPQLRFKDIATKYVSSQQNLDEFIISEDNKPPICKIKNSLVIIDETPMFFINGKVTQTWLTFESLAGEYNNDIIYICHHPKQIPPQVSNNITHLAIFYTGSSETAFITDKLQNAHLALTAMQVIQMYIRNYPAGNDGFGEYPKFPHVFINLIQSTVSVQNMPEAVINANKITIPYNKFSDPKNKDYDKEKYSKYN